MFLVEPQQRRASILEYLTKGKGKVAEEGLVGAKRGRPKMVHRVPRPNANFADPLPDEDSTDEDITSLLELDSKVVINGYADG